MFNTNSVLYKLILDGKKLWSKSPYSTFIASKSIHQFYLQSQIVSSKIYENSTGKYLIMLFKKPRINTVVLNFFKQWNWAKGFN